MTRIYAGLAALALVSCGGGSRSGYPLDAALASAIPADTRFLGGGRWDLLQKSPLFGKAETMLPGDGLSDLKTRFGIDIRTDVKEFAVAHNGSDALLLLRGAFPAKALAGRLEKEGAARSEYKGKSIFARGDTGVALLSESLIAGGPIARLRECVDRLAQAAPLPERFAKALAATPASAHLWFSGAGGATLNLPQGSNLGNVDKVLASLETVNGWGDASKGLRVSAAGICSNDASAKQLHTQLRGLLGMGRLSTPDNQPELLKLFDGLQTKLDGKSIQIEVDLAADLIEKAMSQLERKAR